MKIDILEIEKNMKEVESLTNCIPTKPQYAKVGKYGVNTVVRRYGSWNKALMSIFGNVVKKTPIPLKNRTCPICNNSFQQQSSEQIYCSRSCGSSAANFKTPKRKKSKKCKSCEELIFRNYTYCKECIKKRLEMIENTPLSVFIEKKKDANRYSQIRQHAKRVMRKEVKICSVCKYTKHVEVCHIKDIKDFLPETLVKTINDRSNLILLCPNCHWEFDHDLLKIDGGPAGD